MITEIPYSPSENFQRLQHLPHPVFLDSARFHPEHGRFSLLAVDPQLTVSTRQGETIISSPTGSISTQDNPWEVLDLLLSRFRNNIVHPFLPMGGAFGFLNYEMGKWLEKLPQAHPLLIDAPEMWFGFYDLILAFDHLDKKGWIISTGVDENGQCCERKAAFRRDQILDELESDIIPFHVEKFNAEELHQLRLPEEHIAAVNRAIGYIRRGDLYQVNLAHPFFGSTNQSPLNFYLNLRKHNPAPFSAFLNYGDGQILSSSPERFLRMDRRFVQSRPIKGTIGRSGHSEADWKNRETLFHSEKNRAELLMITDLVRNDLGRIAEFGSVKVPDLVRCEEYETVFHLVSTVEAQLRPHILHLDTLAACFPGGSITGAPKIRAMEIIHELEPWGRGIYTGSLGYSISDFNICIRTLSYKDGQVCFHVGGGIVADSDPAAEYEETLHKARGILPLWPKSDKFLVANQTR
jgi:para-aminobenzoate synthetase component I